MTAITHLIIVDSLKADLGELASCHVITAQDYLANKLPAEVAGKTNLRVINLCNDYRYLKTGYYCSLLAEAWGHRCIPSAPDILHTNWKRLHKQSLPELEAILQKAASDETRLADAAYFFFGRTEDETLQVFGRALFDLFRLPVMKVSFQHRQTGWKIDDVSPVPISKLGERAEAFRQALSKYTGTYWNRKKADNDKYWLAILHDPDEKLPPSNKRALDKFIRIGKKKRFFVELITRHNLESLLEYDALFIRESTNVNHHTYRFAQKAEKEGIPCIDDTTSILRCCNKIYLHELLRSKKIRTPRTYFISRQHNLEFVTGLLDFPMVLKVPDGSFSLGVFKVNNPEEFSSKAEEIFKFSELLLIQEFLPSHFDWRIVILGGQPLFACQYFMARKHWQIYNHAAKTGKEGDAKCIALENVPQPVMQAALKASALIGNGLYGVDVKEIDGVPYIIEINDNPNIDAGVEDRIAGDALYEAVFNHFQQLIDG